MRHSLKFTIHIVARTIPQTGGVARPLEAWLNAKPCRVRGAQYSVRRRTRKGARSEAEGVQVNIYIITTKKVHTYTARGACMYFFYYMVVMKWIGGGVRV